MFGKKKKAAKTAHKPNSNLSPLMQQANELRKAVLSSQRKCERIVAQHTRELEGVKDPVKRTEIDNKYGKALLTAEHDADAIYDNYRKLLHENFSNDEIAEAGARFGFFMDKKLINNLDKLAKSKKAVVAINKNKSPKTSTKKPAKAAIKTPKPKTTRKQ